MKAYKGFNKDMTCRGFQFEEGKTYEEPEAYLCETGFHACEDPIDCLSYYAPGESVYREVELDGVSDEKGEDSKVCAKKITVGAEIGIPGIVKAHFEYVKARCEKEENGGDRSALNGGNMSALRGGNMSALNGGYMSALNGGDRSALNGGNMSALRGGNMSALNGGNMSALRGGNMSALNGGYMSALNGGDRSALRGGMDSKFKGGKDTVFAAEWWEKGEYKGMKAAIVDGVNIKADTWYKLENGEFVEVSDDE